MSPGVVSQSKITLANHLHNKERAETFDSIINRFTDCEELRDALNEFVKYRTASKKKNPFTVHALKLNIATLKKLTDSETDMVNIVNQTIMSGWSGFFPLKSPAGSLKRREGGETDADLEEYLKRLDF